MVDSRKIVNERWALEKERRLFRENVMAEFDKEYYKKLKVLQDQCEEGGHSWKFTHFGPLGNPWYVCTCCAKSKCDPSDTDEILKEIEDK